MMKIQKVLLLLSAVTFLCAGTAVQNLSDYGAPRNAAAVQKAIKAPAPDGIAAKPADAPVSRTGYSLGQLADMSYYNCLQAIKSLGGNYWDLQGLFQNTAEARKFYGDSLRIIYLCDSLKSSCAEYTATDDKGVIVLVEIIRCGSWLGFNYDGVYAYLANRSFKKKHFLPAITTGIANPNFKFGERMQDRTIKAIGSLLGSGVATPEIANSLVPVLTDFTDKFDTYYQPGYYSKNEAWSALGSGITYAIECEIYHELHNSAANWHNSSYFNKINSFINAFLPITAKSYNKTNSWLIKNAIYWLAGCGRVLEKPQQINLLNQIFKNYPRFSSPYMEVLSRAQYYYKGECSDEYNRLLTDAVIQDMKTEIRAQFLKNHYSFDDGKVKFIVGDTVTPEKAQKLYWAINEVKAHFFRYTGVDQPLEPENRDSVLTAIIYGTKSDYQDFQYFLNGLSTDNGGMYIEGQGTFYTFERTPSESIYTLEELFRHEYTHFLQGRYQESGLWGQSAMYDNDRLTWFDEGGAEFTAGSTRTNSVIRRKCMAENIASDAADRFTLSDVLHATYSSGFTFYTYAWAFYDFMYRKRHDLLNSFIGYAKASDQTGWDQLITSLDNNQSLQAEYADYLQDLRDSIAYFTNITTSDDYSQSLPAFYNDWVKSAIESVTGALGNPQVEVVSSQPFHNQLKIRGTYTFASAGDAVSDFQTMNDRADIFLKDLNQQNCSWINFSSYTAYFANYQVQNGQAVFDLVFRGITTDPRYSSAISIPEMKPEFKLAANYPNPFNPVTTIKFDLPYSAEVKLTVYDVAGQQIATLADGLLNGGSHSREFDGAKLSSGVYFYQLTTGDKIIGRHRMLMIK